jgi:head-tail adaptor
MTMTPSGRYRKRIVILTVSRAAKGDNGEEIESWPEPEAGTNTYSAAVESFGANEVIGQGTNHATGTKRLRIRGRAIAVTVSDQVRDKVTGEVFHITGVVRDEYDTILDVSRVKGQEAGQ